MGRVLPFGVGAPESGQMRRVLQHCHTADVHPP